jgi:hypothetical protein
MDRQKLIQSINDEIATLRKAADLLSSTEQRTAIQGKSSKSHTFIMNASARKKISDAQKARWAKVRKTNVTKERAAASKMKKPAVSLSSGNSNRK